MCTSGNCLYIHKIELDQKAYCTDLIFYYQETLLHKYNACTLLIAFFFTCVIVTFSISKSLWVEIFSCYFSRNIVWIFSIVMELSTYQKEIGCAILVPVATSHLLVVCVLIKVVPWKEWSMLLLYLFCSSFIFNLVFWGDRTKQILFFSIYFDLRHSQSRSYEIIPVS